MDDSQTFGSSISETFDFDVSEESFNRCMRKIPIWDFLKICKDHCLSLSRDEKLKLIKNYIQARRNEVNGELFI